jgi:DNA-binding transcriptional LysR family regulator
MICAKGAQMENITLLRLFVQVADEGSFSAVARSTQATPSAVSRQISRLEEDLGTRLLQRTTRQQVLTEAGEIYLRHARQIIEDVDEARRAVSQASNAPSGILRVTAEADLAVTFLSPMLPDFLNLYPAIRIQFVTSATLEDLVGRGIDVAIRVGHLEDSNLMARRLTTSRSLVVASPGYLEQNGTPMHPDELSKVSCMSFHVRSGQRTWQFRSPEGTLEVPVSGRIQAGNLTLLKEAVKSGLGVAMLPTWVVRDELDSGALVPILPDFPLEPSVTPISAVYPSGRNLANKVRVFVEYLSNHTSKSFE